MFSATAPCRAGAVRRRTAGGQHHLPFHHVELHLHPARLGQVLLQELVHRQRHHLAADPLLLIITLNDSGLAAVYTRPPPTMLFPLPGRTRSGWPGARNSGQTASTTQPPAPPSRSTGSPARPGPRSSSAPAEPAHPSAGCPSPNPKNHGHTCGYDPVVTLNPGCLQRLDPVRRRDLDPIDLATTQRRQTCVRLRDRQQQHMPDLRLMRRHPSSRPTSPERHRLPRHHGLHPEWPRSRRRQHGHTCPNPARPSRTTLAT